MRGTASNAETLAGKLPQVSRVVTDQITSEHPIGPPVNGERFVNGLPHALAADPDTFNSTVVGPNRFLRRVTGNAVTSKGVETRSRIAVTASTGKLALWLDFVNSTDAAATFTVTSNNYHGDGPWTYPVAPGRTASDYFNAVAYTNGWYDFTVTVTSDGSWSRRSTGHIETGAPSVTG